MNVPKTGTISAPETFRNLKTKTGENAYGIDRWLVQKFLQAIGEPPLRVVLWDGTVTSPPGSHPVLGMVIHNRATLWRLLTNPLLHFGDDYGTGQIEIEGGKQH